MEVQEGLASPFQQKLGFTQMLRVVRVDTSNAYTVYPFQFLRVKDPFLKYGHICVLTRNVLCKHRWRAS